MNSSFFQSVPTFMTGAHQLRSELIPLAFVLAFAGMIAHLAVALLSHRSPWGAIIRLTIVSLLISSLPLWSDLLATMATELVISLGVNGSPQTVFQDYQAAIARKMGTAAAAAQGQSQMPVGIDPTGAPQNAQGLTPQNGTMLTTYGYANDLTPDTASKNGVGAFAPFLTQGSLIAYQSPGQLASAALSPDMVAKFNVQQGQQFSVTSSTGQVFNLVYSDNTDKNLTGRVDIYDPNSLLGGNNGGVDGAGSPIINFGGGPVVMGSGVNNSVLPNPGGSVEDQIMWSITLFLSWMASGVMWLMLIVQQLLYIIEVAISPVFIGLLMIPALSYLASRYFLSLIGIIIWPLGWAICNLVTMFLIDLAVNPTAGAATGIAGLAGSLTGPLAGLAYLIIIGVWVIGSAIGVPCVIRMLLGGNGGSAVAAMFGATVGAAASQAGGVASSIAGGAVMGPIGAATAAMNPHQINAKAPRVADEDGL